MEKNSKIFIAGKKGMVGSAIWRTLSNNGYSNLIGNSSSELDLRNQNDVSSFYENEKPEYVFLAAAKVGGILANDTYKADFIYDNLQIQNNIIYYSYLNGVKKLIFLGSSCIYPKNCPQPMKESYLLDGKLEPTNEPYAIAKIAGIKMCESFNLQYGTNFVSVMPTNLYGINDNFDLNTSHVLPALIRKFHESKSNKISEVNIWGDGTPKREFLYVDDMANACIFIAQNIDASQLIRDNISHINIGSGKDITISDLAKTIMDIVNYKGEINYDVTKPNGVSKKLLDVSYLENLGWQYNVDLKEGLKKTYDWYVENNLSI